MITSIAIDSLTLSVANGYYLSDTAGFDMPDIRTEIADRGNYDGARLGLYNYGRRVFKIEGEIWGSSASDYESKRRAIEQAFAFNRDTGLKTMTVTTRGGLSVQADVILRSLDMPYKKGDVIHGSFRIEVEAPYPYLLGINEHSVDVPVANGGGFAIPIAIPFSVAEGSTGETTIANSGNGIAYPVITIYGGIQNPSIRNNTADENLTMNYSLASVTDTIVIDVYARTAALNGTVNILQYVNDAWPSLEPGNNIIRFYGVAATATAKANFTYRDAYIGI